MRGKVRWLLTGAVLVAALALMPAAGARAAGACNLGPGGSIHHVVYVQFDNTHLMRDMANVPSDLEQMPALKNFLTSNGTLDSNDHTILISHTAGGIISSITGLYPDRNGITVSNSYGVFKPDGSIDQPAAPAFTYWTDPATDNDPLPNLITNGQRNTPAPWVPFTRAGCDVGAFSLANLELENTKTTPSGDMTKVFGAGSPEWNFANDATIAAGKKVTDFEGIAVHCAQGSARCASGQPDSLPDEPGGYLGFKGLFGATSVNPAVTGQPSTQDADGATWGVNDVAPPVNDVYDFSGCTVDGGPCPATTPIQDTAGRNGFPGFNPSAAQTLGYVAAMQESGIPVTFAYIADAHDDHENCAGGHAFGPGDACYVQQLHHYDQAFQAFFERLAGDGLDKSNTLFVFTVEEGDHYAGGPPTNPGCDGVHTACTYDYTTGSTSPNSVGEINAKLTDLLAKEAGDAIPFDYHFDDAPTIYVHGNGSIPGPTDPNVRRLERDISGLTATNPRTGREDSLVQHIADPVTQDILHMTNTDPLRTPSFTLFGNADYFFTESGMGNCATTSAAGCPIVKPAFAWNHGDDNPEIARTWVGMVGPGVRNLGQTGDVWTDHTDLRPTMLTALKLRDDYASDGDIVTQELDPSVLPANVAARESSYQELMAALKQLNAPFGQFGHDAEIVSTTAVQTTSPAAYNAWDSQLTTCRNLRNSVAGTIQGVLNGAAAGTARIDPARAAALVGDANSLIGDMHALSQMNVPPAYSVCGASNRGPQGPPGPRGPQGAQGKRGKHGRNATVRCTVRRHRHAKRVRITCKVTFVSRRVHEARLVLKHGRRTVAKRRTVHSGRVTLTGRRGRRYRLIVSILVDGQSRTIAHRTLRM